MSVSLASRAPDQDEALSTLDFQTVLLLLQAARVLQPQGGPEPASTEVGFELASRIGLNSVLQRHKPGKAITGAGGSPVVDWALRSTPHRGIARDSLEAGFSSATTPKTGSFLQDLLSPLILWFMDLPASESHHHSHPYGLLDHSLEVALAVLIECVPRFAPEDRENRAYPQALQLSLALSLVHDVGKLLNVEVKDKKTAETWDPMREPLAYFKARHEIPILEPTEFRFRPGRGLNGHEQKGRELLPIILHPRIWRSMGPKISQAYEAYTGRYETPTPARPVPLDFIADCVHRADGASASRSRAKGSMPGQYLLELVANAERTDWNA